MLTCEEDSGKESGASLKILCNRGPLIIDGKGKLHIGGKGCMKALYMSVFLIEKRKQSLWNVRMYGMVL